jgi:putative phosphonate metabolism protein
MDRRLAIFAAPPRGSALGRWGAAWLGRDAESGAAPTPPALPGWSPADFARLTEFPRRYGLHATLKPPFRLAAGTSEAALIEAAERLAAALPPPAATRLRLAALGGFLALVPEGDAAGLRVLADICVERLDRFRAPPSAAELARRQPERLGRREREHLARWGYPYVFDTFRFHITLTGSLAADEREAVRQALVPLLEPVLAEPLRLADIALFTQDDGGPFRLVHRFPLGG